MVAKIHLGKRVAGAIHYSESKIKNRDAALLDAAGYWKDAKDLSLKEKLFLMDQHTSLNARARYKCLHVSLNFHPSETHSPAKLRLLAAEYMERIGFGGQPYLVYEHYDAAHPHIHIVAPTIKADGKLIDLNFIGRKKSEPACRALEEKYDLIRAVGSNSNKELIPVASIVPALYGKSETKMEIARVVNAVLRNYRFTNLEQFAVVLQQYGIGVDTGAPDSVMRAKGGISYHILGSAGTAASVSVQSSRITGKPTTKRLADYYKYNKQQKNKLTAPLRRTIDDVLALPDCQTLADFERLMAARQVVVNYRANADGRIYGITFIDNINRVVFNGSELSKNHSIAGIERRLSTAVQPAAALITASGAATAPNQTSEPGAAHSTERGLSYPPDTAPVADLIYLLLRPEYAPTDGYDPYKKRRKNNDKELHR